MSLLSDLHTSKVLSSSVVKVYIDAYFSYKNIKILYVLDFNNRSYSYS